MRIINRKSADLSFNVIFCSKPLVFMIKFLNLVHASNVSIRIRSTRKQSLKFPLELAKIKQQEFLFVLSFVRFLAYVWTMILCLRRSLCHRLDFISLFCLLFCPYAYAYIQVQTLLVIA